MQRLGMQTSHTYILLAHYAHILWKTFGLTAVQSNLITQTCVHAESVP